MPSRTIDNLGVDSYTRYAEDQKKVDKTLFKEPKKASQQAQIDVATPSYRSQFLLLLGMADLHPPWAAFSVPFEFATARKNLFTSQLLPFMGSAEKREALKERVKRKPDEEREKRKGKGLAKWEEEKEEEEVEKEKDILLTLFSCLESLNKDIMEIVTKMKQFQKG